jgi:hypothetical protein
MCDGLQSQFTHSHGLQEVQTEGPEEEESENFTQ